MAKKRINIYVDEDIYKEFKKVCALSGETVTSVVDEAMKQYIDSIKDVINQNDSHISLINERINNSKANIENNKK